MQGIIIGNIANLYKIEIEGKVYNALARRKIKKRR